MDPFPSRRAVTDETMRDLAVLGGTGASSPAVVFGAMLALVEPGAIPAIAWTIAFLAIVGTILGSFAGAVLGHARLWASERPWLLLPVGFAIGSIAATPLGILLAGDLDYGGLRLTLGAAMVGGLTVGLVWPLFLALRLQGRTATHVLAAAGFVLPPIATGVVVGVLSLGV